MTHKIKCMKDLEIFSALDKSEKNLVVRAAKPMLYKYVFVQKKTFLNS